MIARPKRERLQDRETRKVVHILSAVHTAGSRPGRPARDPVDQPIVKRVFGEAASAPGSDIFAAQAETAQRLLVSVRALIHGRRQPANDQRAQADPCREYFSRCYARESQCPRQWDCFCLAGLTSHTVRRTPSYWLFYS